MGKTADFKSTERFDRLIEIIHTVKREKLGSNSELADFCGHDVDPSQTSRWFWTKRPNPVPKASVTLRALRWACRKKGVEEDDFLVPDWEILRFYLFHSFWGQTVNALRLADKYSADPWAVLLPAMEATTPMALGKRIGIDAKTLEQYARHPWDVNKTPAGKIRFTQTRGAQTESGKSAAREPNGAFALNFLADCYRTPENLQLFIEFLVAHLEDYPYSERPSGGDDLKAEHDAFIERAKNKQALYCHGKIPMPTWLRRIVM